MKHVRFIPRFATLALALLMTGSAFADELVPATSEDLAQFDQQLAKQAPPSRPSQAAAVQNFGKKVSSEAHKLNSQDPSQMKKFGKWVKAQRGQEDRGSGLSGMDRDRDGVGASTSGMPTNGSAFPGNSGRHRDSERRGENKKD